MINAVNSSYYIVEYDGVVIPKKKATKYLTLAKYCISHYVPKNTIVDDNNTKRCCCRIAEILYCYCRKNNDIINSKKEVITLCERNQQVQIQIRNTIILYLKINILQKAE